MKHLALLFCVSLLAVTAPAPSARADVAVSIGFFYDALDPYGDWIYTPGYGYVWQPAAAQQPDWAPYSDGYWAYTDAGWTWISNEDHGWATYHYGRWVRMNRHWCWVPGYEWAPAWVSWRQSDDYVGWAPLPPEARWFANTGFSSWTDSHYDIGPSYYSFVPLNRFSSRGSLSPFIMDRGRNVTYVDRSVNITNISYRNNVVNNIFVGGPDPSRMDRFGREPVRRLSLRRDDDGFRRDWMDRDRGRPDNFRGLSRIENDQLLVAAPSVRRDDAANGPDRVRERFDKPEIDRGWRDAGDEKSLQRLRDRNRDELAKIGRDKMPEKTPLIVTGKTPPPQVGDARPRDRDQRPDPRRHILDEEVRKALPDRPAMPRTQDQPPGVSKGGPPDRDGQPGRGDRPGLPGMSKGGPPDRDGIPGRDGVDRPGGLPGMSKGGQPDRDGVPGRDRDGLPKGLPGTNKGGPPDRDNVPGLDKDSRPKGLPGTSKGGPPDRDKVPGLDKDSRPRGLPDVEPRKQLPERVKPSVPVLPSKPQVKPDMPPQVTPGRRRQPDESREGGVPMPKKAAPEVRRVAPPEVKRPEARRMPSPDVRAPEVRRMPKPEAPSRVAPPSLPKAMPQPAPKVRSAPPPQVRPTPAPRPAPVPQVRPAPTPKPAPAAAPAGGPPGKRKDPRR